VLVPPRGLTGEVFSVGSQGCRTMLGDLA
jgi:hypothetical protein